MVIILAGGLTCVACYFIGRGSEEDPKTFVSILDGLLSGALTSTPGFSAAKATVQNLYASTPDLAEKYEAAVTVGYGIGLSLRCGGRGALCPADAQAHPGEYGGGT